MSSLLKEAIVDAKALRESALKNAETIVIEKYSEEVKDTLQKLLEQEDDLGLALPGEEPAAADAGADPLAADPLAAEEPALDAAPAEEDPLDASSADSEEGLADEDIPLGATNDFADMDGDNLDDFVGSGEGQQLTIDLGALQESIEALKQSIDEDEEVEITEDQLEEIFSEDEVDEALSPAIAAAMKAKGMSTDGAAVGEPGLDPQKLVNFYKNKLAKLEQELKALAGSDPAKAKAKMKMIFAVKQQLASAQKQAGRMSEENEEEINEILPALADVGKAAAAAAAKDMVMGDDGDDDELDEEIEEELDQDALVDAIMEKLTVDMGADLAGWAGRSQEDKVYQIEKEMAHRVSTDVAEELENLKKAHEELVFENNQLAEQNNKYNEALQELKENLQDVNLSNARLLYTNRVLRNPSLNERQKNKIAEAISSAGSVREAKTIFETLQSTVESAPKKSPKSLSEAIGRRSSVLRATRKEQPSSDPVSDRMKILAGIK